MNGWCSASQRPSSSFHSNIGKSTTHSSAWAAPAAEVEPPRQLEPQLAERLGGDGRLVGHHQQQVAGLGAQQAPDRRALVVGEELGDRRAPRAVLLHERPHEAAGAEALDQLGQLVELRPRHLARARVEAAHDLRPWRTP